MGGSILVGCCGFPKSRPVYFEHFEVDEIQQTFYRLPMLKTAERWRAEAPHGFHYTLKAWQLITHEPYQPTYRRAEREIPRTEWSHYGSFRPTIEVMDAWEATLKIALAMEAEIVVFQCPPQFTPSPEHLTNMRSFFERARRGQLLFAWEPRGQWPAKLVSQLCTDLSLLHCVDPFIGLPVTSGSLAYFRVHGGPDYRHQYTDPELVQLAEWCRQYQKTYCLFNNATMWEDALRFKDILDN